MLTRRELENAINECENLPLTYQNCEKLATFYMIYDHLYTTKEPRAEIKPETIINDYGISDFLVAVKGKQSAAVWGVIDELMSALKIVMPKLYDGALEKIENL